MKAVFINEFGDYTKLIYAEQPTPEPGEAEVLVKIKAAGVNPVDWKIREGWLHDTLPHQFPLIPGWEMAGEVEAVGHAARRFEIGDEVYAYCRRPVVEHGTYAEYIALPESYLSQKPHTMSFEQAAAVPLAGLTAYQAVNSIGEISAGQSLLVVGASGGVGSFAVQLGKLAGAKVIGVASGANLDYMKELGADIVLDYTEADFGTQLHKIMPDGVDLAFDCVGGETIVTSYECVRNGGRLISIVTLPDSVELPPRDVAAHYVFVEPNALQLDYLCKLIEEGLLTVQVREVFPLEQAAKAQQISEQLHTQGKLVLKISD